MTGWKMYSEIHQLKSLRLNKSQVARQLNINVKTVSKYWVLDPDDFAEIVQKSSCRSQKLTTYKDVILRWLQNFPDISAAQIQDWLKENYPGIKFRERTVRRFVARLRKEHSIVKRMSQRQYQAVADPPMGKQMQIDFGETTVRKSTGGFFKIYGMGAVLSHSRYKYSEWSDKPLTTATFIQMLGHCFDYMEGIPKELVFDQDRLLAVSENYGDVIYTYEFEKFKQSHGFSVRLCRANDPESKGRVEAVVKYMKRNFADNRLFIDLKIWNRCCEDWLERTANQKIHGITKKVPAEVFLLEKQYLQPVPFNKAIPGDIVTRAVRKDNTILYNSNRYSVPLGTYRPGLELQLREETGMLIVLDPATGQAMAKHQLSPEKGALIQNNHHLRDNTKKIDEIYERTLNLLGGGKYTADLLSGIRREKSRYVRDQLRLMEQLALKYPAHIMNQAMAHCLELKLYSAVDCRDAAAYFLTLQKEPAAASLLDGPGAWPEHLNVQAQKRSITAYTSLLGGDKL